MFEGRMLPPVDRIDAVRAVARAPGTVDAESRVHNRYRRAVLRYGIDGAFHDARALIHADAAFSDYSNGH